MKRRIIVLILIVAITLSIQGIILVSDAQNNLTSPKKNILPYCGKEDRELVRRGFKEDQVNRMGELINSLNLTEEQKKEIEKIIFNFQKETIELESKLKVLELEIRELFLQPNIKFEDIQGKLKEEANLEVELKGKAVETYFKIRDLLTPEQQSKITFRLPFLHFLPGNMKMYKVMKPNCW